MCVKLLTVGKRNDIYERFDADPDIDVGADIDLSGAQPIPIQTMHYDEPKVVAPVSGEDAYQPEETESSDQEIKSGELLRELLVQWHIPENDIPIRSRWS